MLGDGQPVLGASGLSLGKSPCTSAVDPQHAFVTDRSGKLTPRILRGQRESQCTMTKQPIIEALRFPRGVRLAAEADLPRSGDKLDELARISSANITTGFVLATSIDPGFSTYIEANVHADEVWSVFEALASHLLPDVSAPLVGWKDVEATLGLYTDKDAALAVLRAHAESLQHDGFIEFGLMFQQGGKTEEVMVKGSKDLRIWTNSPAVAMETLSSLGIPSVEKLQFIDEYPRVTERLVGDPSSQETISAIVGAFQSLPPK
jgi:hypothetical protein